MSWLGFLHQRRCLPVAPVPPSQQLSDKCLADHSFVPIPMQHKSHGKYHTRGTILIISWSNTTDHQQCSTVLTVTDFTCSCPCTCSHGISSSVHAAKYLKMRFHQYENTAVFIHLQPISKQLHRSLFVCQQWMSISDKLFTLTICFRTYYTAELKALCMLHWISSTNWGSKQWTRQPLWLVGWEINVPCHHRNRLYQDKVLDGV